MKFLVGDRFIDETTGYLWQVKHIQAIGDSDCYGLERISICSPELWIIPVDYFLSVKTTLIPQQVN